MRTGVLRYFVRFRSTDSQSSNALLFSLRKKTGFPILKCKEALVKHGYDLKAAEKALYEKAKAEDWQRVQGRKTQHGLIGVLLRKNEAAMIEVNCETDFVARNTQFCSLVSAATQATLDLHQQQQQESDQRSESDHPPSLWQRQLTAADITSLGPWSHYTTLNDMVTEKFGSLSENLAIARGCLMRAKEGLLCSYVYCNVDLPLPEPTITSDQTATTTSTTTNTSGHNNTTEVVAMGTYVALVHLLPKEGTDLDVEVAQKLGRAVGQHIVGLNPTSIYPRPRDESGEEPGDKGSALVEQALLIGDDSLTVGDVLEKNRMTVSSFMRYGLGETQDDC